MKHFTWIIDENGTPKKVDMETWARWCLANPRFTAVRQEFIGNYWISTVFMGINHNFDEKGAPILWETMVFPKYANAKHWTSQYQTRCAGNREQAEAMHEEMVKRICKAKHIEYKPQKEREENETSKPNAPLRSESSRDGGSQEDENPKTDRNLDSDPTRGSDQSGNSNTAGQSTDSNQPGP